MLDSFGGFFDLLTSVATLVAVILTLWQSSRTHTIVNSQRTEMLRVQVEMQTKIDLLTELVVVNKERAAAAANAVPAVS